MKQRNLISLLIAPALALVLGGCATASSPVVETYPTPDKLIALTFDDGPDNEKTGKVLDRLKKYGVVATFFQVGQRIGDGTKPTIDRLLKLNCEVENHSATYSPLNSLPAEQVQKNVDKTSELIKQYTGRAPAFFRAPNLATSQTMFDNINLTFIQGVVCNDWGGCNTSAQDRANKALAGARDGAIILLHDVQGDPHPTPEALDILIPELRRQGYEFVTVSELFRRKGVAPTPKTGKVWTYVQ